MDDVYDADTDDEDYEELAINFLNEVIGDYNRDRELAEIHYKSIEPKLMDILCKYIKSPFTYFIYNDPNPCPEFLDKSKIEDLYQNMVRKSYLEIINNTYLNNHIYTRIHHMPKENIKELLDLDNLVLYIDINQKGFLYFATKNKYIINFNLALRDKVHSHIQAVTRYCEKKSNLMRYNIILLDLDECSLILPNDILMKKYIGCFIDEIRADSDNIIHKTIHNINAFIKRYLKIKKRTKLTKFELTFLYYI